MYTVIDTIDTILLAQKETKLSYSALLVSMAKVVYQILSFQSQLRNFGEDTQGDSVHPYFIHERTRGYEHPL